eukprot:CAMPEP_0201487758 /NCGR_PEP_ID=MMETSP0151_2-20130828/15212_1 /ASSEMBLY_ACC=CAM_ASM_000257 /TAXON_ID=200890 /ORGANISM="Paramoeba atlantica, Strain 621/1 / CCAP 1560/9" /LENGTH=127 /DNA_ID=CAMNT_0047872903 /DNA_START=524 /DNA_END=906 /DNA_ORIENTATION=-
MNDSSLIAVVDERKEEEEYLLELPSSKEGKEVEVKEEEEQGIVVVDEDEEEEEEGQLQEEKREKEIVQTSSKIQNKRVLKGKFLLSMELSKTIIVEDVEAKFEQEKLIIYLPSRSSSSLHSREIEIQ